ncbi:MAG: hypothetical protein CXZ00_14140 [Acidobacteria bacterium]|nr:MAG: hypothetical protein CXZ00_14140 [Acidobacteriota bacterium]
MSTSPILEALAPQPSAPLQLNSGSCDSADKSTFYQVLQQLSSPSTESAPATITPNVTPNTSDNMVPADDKAIAALTHSALAAKTTKQDTKNAAQESCASKEPLNTTNNFPGSKAKKEKAVSKIVCADAKQDSATARAVTNSAVIPLFSVQIPVQTDSLQITSAAGDSDGSAQKGSVPQISTTSLNLSVGSGGASVATNGTLILRAAAALSGEHASTLTSATESETAHSLSVSFLPTSKSLTAADDVVASDDKLPVSSTGDSKNKVSESATGKTRTNVSSAAESKAQPLPEFSPETTIAVEPSGQTGKDTGSSSATTQYVSLPEQPVVKRASLHENSADNHSPAPVAADSSVSQAAFRANRSSQEKTSGSRTTVDHASASASASGSSRPPALQVSSAAIASVDAPTAASALLAQHTQEIAQGTTRAEPSIQPNPVPDPPRMVDSGHLTVHNNSTELKISVQLPELGKVEVRAIATHDTTTAHLTASTHNALQVLNSDRIGLEQTLRARDVTLGSLDTQTQGQSAGHQHQQNFQSQTPFAMDSTPVTAATTIPVALDASSSGDSTDHSGINVRI